MDVREWDEPTYLYELGDLMLVIYDGKMCFAVCTELLDDGVSHRFIVVDDGSQGRKAPVHLLAWTGETFTGQQVGMRIFTLSQVELDTLKEGVPLRHPLIYLRTPIDSVLSLVDQFEK